MSKPEATAESQFPQLVCAQQSGTHSSRGHGTGQVGPGGRDVNVQMLKIGVARSVHIDLQRRHTAHKDAGPTGMPQRVVAEAPT